MHSHSWQHVSARCAPSLLLVARYRRLSGLPTARMMQIFRTFANVKKNGNNTKRMSDKNNQRDPHKLRETKTRAYGREELALMYNPHETPGSAWRVLKGWITHNQELSDTLRRMGYDGHERHFTPAQVEKIFYYLGEP